MYEDSPTPTDADGTYEVPEIPKPEGGGSLGGAERFRLDTASGSARFEIPLPGPEARGLAPELALVYRGGTENGLFGLGVGMDLPAISRRTALGVPRYDESDHFVTESGDVLTPRRALIHGSWQRVRRWETRDGVTYRVTDYRRRIESTFDRIEYWESTQGPAAFWTITDHDNVTSVFGRTDASRLVDPDAPERIFRWMIEERRDAKGNWITHGYDKDDTSRYASLYPTTIAFAPFPDEDNEAMAYRYVFDYGDSESCAPSSRPDVVISFRPGFELRVARRCTAIGLEHYFPGDLGPEPVRVQEVRLAYAEAWDLSLLESVTRVGYGTSQSPNVEKASPPISLGFTEWQPEEAAFALLNSPPQCPIPSDNRDGALRFADLLGEGVPGVLSQASESDSAHYWPPEGGGMLGPPTPLPSAPVSALDKPTRHALLDLSGLGHLDAVTLTAGQSGYFGNNGDGTWAAFQAFQDAPLGLEDPSAAFVDLRGNGRPDLVSNGPADWRINDCQGRVGYQPARPTSPPKGAFDYGEAGEAARIQFANVFGDGLSHLVRISSGCVRIWPNLGGGRFGPPRDVSIGSFPTSVTTQDILMADLTGAGGTDICVFGPTHITIYQNHYGQRFSHVRTLPLPMNNSRLASMSAADLDGIGVSRIIIGTGVPSEAQWTLDLANGIQPFLLNRIDNGMGRQTQLTYRSSTAYYFAARATGKPWQIRSPFPVNVVESVAQRDAISGATLTRFIEYRDGYFDPVDRQFAGFAYAQVRDHPVMDPEAWQFTPPQHLAQASLEPGVEPLFTRTWSHVGDMSHASVLRESMLKHAYRGGPEPLVLPRPYFDPLIDGADAETRRLAWRALANHPIRSEAFPVDADGMIASTPFGVDQSAYAVRLVQPAMDGQPAVVQVLARETARTSYERQADDPQTFHVLKTAFDDFGQWTRSLKIGYARFPMEDRDILPSQASTGLRLTTRGLINHVDGAYRNASGGTATPLATEDGTSSHFVGLPFAKQSFELAGFPQPIPYFSYNDAVAVVADCLQKVLAYGEPFTGEAEAQLFHWTRIFYWETDQTTPAALQQTGPQALVHHTAKATFSDAFVSSYYGGEVDQALLADQGGYVHEDGYWWWTGDTVHYAGLTGHHLPTETIDPFGTTMRIKHDAYDLFIIQRVNAKGDKVSAVYDYRALSPARIVDENNNATEFAYDPLSEVLLRAVYGTEGDTIIGDRPLSDYSPHPVASPGEVLADPAKYLQGAGRYFLYDLEAWNHHPRLPPFTLELERRQFARTVYEDESEQDAIAITLRYFDGAGRDLATAELVSGQPPYPLFGDSTPRLATQPPSAGAAQATEWRITHQVRYDNRGDVVTRYQPYFATVPAYQARPDVAHWSLRHDGLHREIKTETPKGFLTRTEYGAWSETHWDEDDLVTRSPYYIDHIDDPNTPAAEKEALRQAADFENTPLVTVRDVLGRTTQTIQYLVSSFGEALKTYAWYNAQDKETAFADARFYNAENPEYPFYYNYLVAYDMLGHGVWQKSADSGNAPLQTVEDGIAQRRLFDGDGQPIAEWNRRGYRLDTTYDALRQPIELRVRGANIDVVVQRFAYGDDPDTNTVNRIVTIWDQAGVLRTDTYTILGEPMAFSRQFTTDPEASVDWQHPDTVPLQDNIWAWNKSWNAVSEQIMETAPNGACAHTSYTLNGWANSVSLAASSTADAGTFSEIATITSFATDGRPRTLTFPGAAEVNADYDPATLRLTATRGGTSSGNALLKLGYIYDPVGNVTQIVDATPIGGGDSDIRHYRYDALYRLRHATGRRQARTGHGTPERYARTYTFDPSNNLTARLDDAGEDFSTVYSVSPSSNHAVTEAMSRDNAPDNYFDADGLMTALPEGVMLSYDPLSQLRRVQTSQAQGTYQYGADGVRVRKSLVSEDDGVTEETVYLENFIATGGTQGRGELTLFLSDRLMAVVHYPSASSTNGATPRLQLSDRIHSVAYELAADGSVLNGQTYYPFGETAIYIMPATDAVESKRYQFAGREWDPESGLYHFPARAYSPSLGRWLTPDPAGTIDGPNLFAYVQNNPISRIDPSGENGGDGDNRISGGDALFKGMKVTNKVSVFSNAIGEFMGIPIHHVATSLKSPVLQFLAAQSVAFGGTAAIGGIFGAGYYARDMQKKGVTPYNVTSFAGNLLFAAEGVMIYRTILATTDHALHLAHQRIGVVGFIADTLKIPKAIKDKDYGSAGLYYSLALGNLRSAMTQSQAARLYTGIFQGFTAAYNTLKPQGYGAITRSTVLNGATLASRISGPQIFAPYLVGYLAYQWYKSSEN
ncbi:hypothetical protein MKP05_13670 [Halomonas sp. EGI 63088]|uniref:Uncharacterized protein n=1 Tax=Halomonas flagellata TaxID=2920385 RepID=A0ABS9RWD7_9GAMM|nr:SpvB/TcaC N-terminal domain-containing protein [Halomonas flagellata]MCH4564161.1 hypothetical protein [Halomonas flagellata]